MIDHFAFIFMETLQTFTVIFCYWYSSFHFFIFFQESLFNVYGNAFLFCGINLLT